ncbi:MAG: hypothetical protein KJ798_14480 [Gammaproteobacteria bacterium]|nr:hypothetical protein [Gammaproteobacteria bacterium]MBU0849242.1 hypothetical protein [Gammaproteobacteria bacterium]MBU1267993.1 hypothetical protein [Gammaproteobacteria bacterium]MBU1528252.1 hypothetical protein [Gammaproteobacteria bacterium]MBU1781579.1 hypothetical protein [Gammaproteobacteria bacterium]
MTKTLHTSALAFRAGHEWMLWLGRAAQHMPDLHRALQFLESSCELMDASDGADVKTRTRQLKQLINRFVGQARCPSAQSCEKIAIRTQVLDGWLQSELQRTPDPNLLVELGAHGLQKLLTICEGADDKHGLLLKAVRELTRDWLNIVSSQVESPIERAHLVYPVAMLDQAGLVDPSWWWKQIALCDRHTVLGLVELEINDMNEMQPTSNVSWRSFDKRWRRLRLRALLEYIGEKRLLAELLRKSAVDDFEAVVAVRMLRDAGRSRDAIVQAEQWMRALPRSPVLADVLFDLYTEDGWDEEALALAVVHHGYDPNPVWIEKLERLGTPAAKAKIKAWKKQHAA